MYLSLLHQLGTPVHLVQQIPLSNVSMLEMAITFIGMMAVALWVGMLFVNLFDGLLKTGDKNGLYV